ncbi:MAG: AAA family ATPase, partial [Planctomycetaceae bacterium]
EAGQVDLPLPPIEAVDVSLAFTRETGLPGWMLDDRIPLDLEAAREWIAARVIGQPEAVDLMVNLLAVLKAQLNRGDRPLANLLFIGPTGVGKTEMAKTLAEFLFGAGAGNDPRLIRVDMSEYADAGSAERLIGGSEKSEGILTARVREQPFSVVLLDELEKAHESLFDLLLQVLGEGRLTDAGGRLADFRNSVVIMTSNLGGATYARRGVGFGLTRAETDRARDHFERSVRDALRPELFNRLDRIVPFLPLDLETARRVVERQLALIRGRDGLKYRQVELTVGEEVVDHLVERGFEPRHGARSLKRVMERDLLAPLAERLNESSQRVAQRADCAVWKGPPGKVLAPEEWRIGHTVRAQTDEQGRPLESAQGNLSQFTDLLELRELQARVTRLRGSSATLDLENTLFRLQQVRLRLEKLQRPFAELWPIQHEMAPLEEWWEGYQALTRRVYAREEEELLAYYTTDTPRRDNPELRSFNSDTQRELTRQLMQLLDRQTETPHSTGLLLVSTSAEAVWWLAEAYSDIAEDLNPVPRTDAGGSPQARVTLWAYLPAGVKRSEIMGLAWDLQHLHWQQDERPDGSPTEETWRLVTRTPPAEGDLATGNNRGRARSKEPEERPGAATPQTVLLRQRFSQWPERAKGIPERTLAVYCEIHGQGAWQRFAGEDGVHRFLTEEGMFDVHVFARQPPVAQLLPPQSILTLDETKLTSQCREYDQRTSRVTDAKLSETVVWRSKRLTPVLTELLFRRHERLAEALIE